MEAPASSVAKLELENQKNGVANLVLACTDCNRGVNGKLSCNIAIVVHTIHILGVVA